MNIGHAIVECKNPRLIDRSNIPNVMPDVAWEELKAAAAADERDLDDIKEAVAKYLKALPDTTYVLLEQAFRAQGINVYIIALERELAITYTNMDLQGNLDRKYTISYRLSDKAKRPKEAAGWPATPEENLERLKDAGEPIDRGISRCGNCSKLGHSFVRSFRPISVHNLKSFLKLCIKTDTYFRSSALRKSRRALIVSP
jgi:hypothetical protein